MQRLIFSFTESVTESVKRKTSIKIGILDAFFVRNLFQTWMFLKGPWCHWIANVYLKTNLHKLVLLLNRICEGEMNLMKRWTLLLGRNLSCFSITLLETHLFQFPLNFDIWQINILIRLDKLGMKNESLNWKFLFIILYILREYAKCYSLK